MGIVTSIQMSDYVLEESGSIITTSGADIHFRIQNLEYVFTFVDEDNTQSQLRVRLNDGHRLELELVNFNNPLGMGNVDPFPMGRIGDNNLFIMIRVYAFDNGGKTLHYSWYSKPIDNNDSIQ